GCEGQGPGDPQRLLGLDAGHQPRPPGAGSETADHMIRRIGTAVLAAVLFVLVAAPAGATPLAFPSFHQEGTGRPRPPTIDAGAWILYDATAGVVLAEYNADTQRAPASITKIMTVLVALEHGNPEDLVTISNRAAATGEKEINVVPGESVQLGAVMEDASIHCAYNVATAIAEHVGWSVSDVVDMMIAKAEDLGMKRTHFLNTHGLDGADHVPTDRDMFTLGLGAMQHPEFKAMAS